MSRLATYLYGLARPGTEISEDLPGVEEKATVRILEIANLAAVVSEVAVEPFESDSMADLAWLVPRAIRHERVIESVRERGPVLPVRFGSLFTDGDVLETWAARNRRSIEDFLDHVENKDEWSIKLKLDLGVALESLSAADPAWSARAAALSASPGTRYFQEKRLHEDARRQAQKLAREAVGRVRAAALALADERVIPPRKPEAGELEPVFHAAYLVPRDATSEFFERHEARRGRPGLLRASNPRAHGPHRTSARPWRTRPPDAPPRILGDAAHPTVKFTSSYVSQACDRGRGVHLPPRRSKPEVEPGVAASRAGLYRYERSRRSTPARWNETFG